jgi:hypothetical protein
MCRALKVLCAAASRERLAEMKRATVSVHWELVGGALSIDELTEQVALHSPDVVVVDHTLGTPALDAVLATRPSVRLVSVGGVSGADSGSLEGVREAILGVQRPGGPVRG